MLRILAMEKLMLRVMTLAPVLATAVSAQTTQLVSQSSAGLQGDYYSEYPSISGDGRFVAFDSAATTLIPGDANGAFDVFVRDLQNLTTERVSVGPGGTEANSHSMGPSISADGRHVAFGSLASNLVPGDTNGFSDVFVYDRLAGTTELVSVSSSGALGNAHSGRVAISADGRYVAFESYASNLLQGDTNGSLDIFVRDRQNGTTERVSVGAGGNQGTSWSQNPSISADGVLVAFESASANLVSGDTNGFADIFVRDRQAGTTDRVSVGPNGAQGNGQARLPAISADGHRVAFTSRASNLVAGDTNSSEDVFVRDRQAMTTIRVSVSSGGAQAMGGAEEASLSTDGRFVAFASAATNLVQGDMNGVYDVFVRDCQVGVTTRISVSSNGGEGDAHSYLPSISADGRVVAFESDASSLVIGDMNGLTDVFARDGGPIPAIVSYCYGDGTWGPCPCGNSGTTMHGCDNSAATGGAILSATGTASLSNDTLVLTSSAELPTALSIVLQGNLSMGPVNYGDGLRCVGGALKRLYAKNAVGGVVTAPELGDPSISARSAARGDVIPPGGFRFYQVYYRDANSAFCPIPPGNTWNVSSALAVAWDF